jgi:hypothetical protein
MSEIKIALDLFEKGDKLDATIKKLKAVDGLVKTINRNKIELVSPDIAKRINALNKITSIEKKLAAEKKKQIKAQEKVNEERKESLGLLGKQQQAVKRLKKEQKFAKTETELKAINSQLQKAQMNVRKFGAAGKKNTNTFSNALSSFGFKFNFLSDIISGTAFALASGLTNAIKDGIEIVKQFEQAQSNLAAVLGTNTDSIKELTEDAKRLGSTTAFTATQVSELQTEYAKLGFSQEEILKVTESTLDASAALRSELGEQAALTGSIIRSFELDAKDATRVNDVLAKAAASSALSFEKLNTALPIVSATAKTAGVSLERTTALLGTLSDRGIDASTAATGLRNVFLELSKRGLTFEQAMNKINTATDKNAAALELFGKRGATIGVILSKTGKNVDDLTDTLENSFGFAAESAATQLDNLAGSITILGSAWEGFILSLEDGGGVFNEILRGAVDTMTELVSAFTFLNSEVDKSIENLDNETEALAKLNVKANDVNLKGQDRIKIIKQLKKDYPDLVSFLNTETSTNEDLRDALEGVNKSLQTRTLIQKALEPVEDRKQQIAKEELALQKELADILIEGQRLAQEAGTPRIFEGKELEETLDIIKELAPFYSTLDGNIARYRGNVEKLEVLQSSLNTRQNEANQTITSLINSQGNLNDLTTQELKNLVNNKVLLDKKLDTEARLIIIGREQEEQLKELNAEKENEAIVTDVSTEATKKNTKAKKDNFNITSAQLALLRQFFNEQELLLKEQRNEGIIDERVYNFRLLQLRKERLEEEIKVLEQNGKDSSEKRKQLADTEYKIAQNQTNRLLKLDQDRLAREKQLEEQRRLVLDERLQSAQDLNNLAKELAGENENAQRAALLAEKGLAVAEISINGQRQIADIGADKDLTPAQKRALQVQAGLQTSIGIATVLATGFAEGGYTGDGGKYDEAGIVHKGEFVNTKEQTSKYGMRNWTAQDFDKKVSEGHFNQFTDSGLFERQNMQFMTIEKKQVGYDFSKLENELKAVKNAILSKPVTSLNVDKLGNLIEETYKNGVKENKVYKRKSRI